MAKKRKKKKPPPGSTDPKGKMRPAEGAPGQPGDEGTRIDDGTRHVFFSFKGELKSGLPDATETDLAEKLGLTPAVPDETATSEPADAAETGPVEGPDADATTSEPDDATGASDPTAAEPDDVAGAADATATEFETGRAATTPPAEPSASAAEPAEDRNENEQSRAGPVRGPDPAAQKTASQSRKAAGPAHFIPPHESPPGDSQAAAPPEAPSAADAEAATHTDVRGEPFAPTGADVTHTEIDAGIFAAPGDDAAETPVDAATETELDAPSERTRVPDARAEPPKAADVRDESAVGSETILDAGLAPHAPSARAEPPKAAPPKPRGKVAAKGDESAVGSETILDAGPASPRKPAQKPGREETAAGSETVLDAEGVRGQRDQETRTHPDAVTGTADRVDAGPDAETVTKEPAAIDARRTATDLAQRETASSPAEVPSFHDAETASQDLAPIAEEAALPPLSPFDLPIEETQSLTEPRPEGVPHEVSPFAGALFDAPAPSTSEEPVPEPTERPRLRSRRRSARKAEEPALKRLVRWAKQHLDPRDFLEIVGTAAFERAQNVGERLRTARRENRVSHTAEWWRKTLVELAILYAIVIPIELAVSGGRLGSFGVHPHPYWLIVLPLAAARGLVAGLIAAGIASILYTIGASQAVVDAIFTFRNMTEPLLFFAVAFFAGELHDEGLLKRKKLDRRIKDLEERTGQLRQQRDVLTDANRELEKRIVDDSVQFGNLIQAARRIERAGRQEVFDLALEMAEEHCGAAATVLILLEDGSLDYLCHRGSSSDEIGKRLALARQSAFVKRAVSEGIAVNGLDPGEVAPPQGPLVVAPLFDSGGVVKALMCLDEIPLARLNESTVTVFLGIADWASAALGRLTRGGDAPAPRTAALSVGPEVDLWLGSVGDLGKRLRIELARCSRYGVATSFLTIQATDWSDATREGIDALDRFMLMHFTTGLRPSDGIYRFGYPGAYLLVLAGTALKGAEVVRTRLERRVSYTTSPVGTIEIRATGPDDEAPDIQSLLARVARGFRDRSKLALDARCPVSIAERIEAEDLNAFLRRLKMETSLAVRNSLDLHVVGISAESSEQAGPGILARHVVEVGEQTLRPTDGVYMIGQYQCAVILPCTNGEEAATVAHRLATLVRARDPSAAYGQIETQVLGLGPNHPDAGSFLTALARRAGRSSR